MTAEPFDHDQLFKEMIREFFADFMTLFFDRWAKRLDLSAPVEWLRTEVYPKPPDGPKHFLDLVAKVHSTVPVRPDDPDPATWLALIHIEIESPDRTTAITPRLPKYWRHLTEEYGLPALPIVIYLKVGLEGLGEEMIVEPVMDFAVNTFRYLYVGLPGLSAEDYRHGDNWLGVALSALMRCPRDRIVEWGAEALRRIGEAPLPDRRKMLLAECVEGYVDLAPEDVERMRGILNQNATGRVPPMNRTSYMIGRDEGRLEGKQEGLEEGIEKGIEKGVETGRRKGVVEFLEAQLVAKFGPLPAESLAKLRQLPDADLSRVGVALLTAASLTDLGL